MKVVVQRVSEASVTIDGQIHGKIDKGFLLLVGIQDSDNEEIVRKMADKIARMRIFVDENDKMNLSLSQVSGDILSISQFTLYADCKHGNRPSFVDCLAYDKANKLYEYFNSLLIKEGYVVKTGVFGADMKISLVNDGPFTLVIDSKELGL